MNLFASIVVTVGVIALIWGLVMLQPARAQNPTPLALTSVAAETSDSAPQPKPIGEAEFLVGITQTIALDSIHLLWEQFEANFHRYLPDLTYPDRVVVLYQNLNSGYSQATVTIGFPSKTRQNAAIKLPPLTQGQTLLERNKHDDAVLLDAWGKLDADRLVDQVVEIHYLSPLGATESSELLVYYK